MKVLCCEGGSDLCKDFTCNVEKTENGFTISFTGENKEKIEKLHQYMNDCCRDDQKSSCC